ncbi:hypothetical protein BO94DRAFT_549757 [Aspergillus sclerotioniger CBS 115572]|uniref:SP-RING-type domain-containing protein n=1 Tax=Aspergillus sclerotioniger CBS 115572 TaxID=1450535 RepID=A0A317VLF0_9EURO|nr:hypothetical protein BO94DRAFT_549757 [Aspergillus sclerotioniger CBS 115572]PWY73768.1 hypothetical protein BO94DRAFT_549757 [Aspergillus sclerotioniger CBS 115572]
MSPRGSNRRSDPANLGFESSNSTANIFLGGVRRSWMRDTMATGPPLASNASASPPRSTTTRSAPTSTAASGGPSGSPQRRARLRETPPRGPPVDLTTSTTTTTTTTATPSSSSVTTSSPSAAPPPPPPPPPPPLPPSGPMAQSDPLQPISTSNGRNEKESNLSRSFPTLPLASSTTIATAVRSVTCQTTALPSPDPSISCSQPSPISAIDRNGAPVGPSPLLTTLPSPPTGGTPPVSATRSNAPQTGLPTPTPLTHATTTPGGVQGTSPILRGPSERIGNTELHPHPHPRPQQPQSQLPSQSQPQPQPQSQPLISHDPRAGPQVSSWTSMPTSPVVQGHQQSAVMRPVPMLPIDVPLFKHWLEKLETFAAEATRNRTISEVVESPRIRLLQSALLDKDPVYLALHQMYCLSSYAPSELRKLPGFGREQEQGLAVVKQLLVDNRRLSGDFLRWCVNFPEPIQNLLARSWWRDALEQIMNSLVHLSRRWDTFEQVTRERGLPPLIEEIIMTFAIRSHVMQYNIFLALYRRLPGHRGEQNLFDIFNRDAKYTDDRLDSPNPVHAARAKKERDLILSMYHKALTSTTAQATTATSQPRIHSQPVESPLTPTSNLPPQTTPHQIMTMPPGSAVPGYETRRSSHASMPGNGPHPTAPSAAGPDPTMSIAPVPYHSHTMPFPSQIARTHSPRMAPVHQPQPPPHPPQVVYPSQVVPSKPENIHQAPLAIHMPGSVVGHPQMAFPPQTAPSHPTNTPVSPAISSPMSVPNLPPTPGSNPASSASAPPPRRRGRPPRSSQPNAQPLMRYRAMQPANQGSQPGPTQDPPPPPPPPSVFTPFFPRRAHFHLPIHDPIRCGTGCTRLIYVALSIGEQVMQLYQYLHSFAVHPTPLGQLACRFDWTFDLPKPAFERLAKVNQDGDKLRPARIITSGQQIFRLRCIQVDVSTETVPEHTWCTTETCWPNVLYMFVNEVEVFARRRQQNGKDLPLEITEQLRKGPNTVTIHVLRSPAEMRDQVYAAAIEILNISDLGSVVAAAQSLPASESQEQIYKRLTPDTDDELSIMSEDLVINLVDPFTARIFNRPVRGRLCTHQECFDHETYITTRASKSGRRSFREDWRCPICKKDARPQTLLVDGFLVTVHDHLSRTNQLDDARAIRVKRDGTWTLKADADTSTEQTSDRISRTASVSLKRKSSDSTTPASQKPKFESAPDNRVGNPEQVIMLD